MTVYSHSRLSTFEQCRYRYKLRYIDKIPSPVEKSIEAHLGTCVHGALEWLYKSVVEGRVPELDNVLEKYSKIWAEEDSDNFIIVRDLTKEDYFNKGVKFLVEYYTKHQPFDDGTLEMEKKVWISLEENFPHKVIGYIDRLVYNKEKDQYEIHDYKTANTLPNKNKFETDRQLALYSIAIKDLYGQDKPVTLNWHYLNYNMRITSRRTNDQLDKLKKETIELIRKIEKTTDFPTNKTPLCEWCEYKQYCKAWGNHLPEEYREKETNTLSPQRTITDFTKAYPTAAKYFKD